MIKRQFYTLEHPSHRSEAASASSSSSSDLSAASQSDADSAKAQLVDDASSPVSIHQSRDSSTDEESVGVDDVVVSDWRRQVPSEDVTYADDDGDEESQGHKVNQWADAVTETEKERADDFAEECVLLCKNVIKCRLCPKTICLTEETMRAHLSSKKHARSLRQFEEGNLRVMLNSDGEEEEQGETHGERYARTLASAQQVETPKSLKRKRNLGRQRQRKRAKRKVFLATKEHEKQPGGKVAARNVSAKRKGMEGATPKSEKVKGKTASQDPTRK